MGFISQRVYSPALAVLFKRLENLNQLRKVRTVHAAIEELCRGRQLPAAYSLRDWAHQLGLSLLPQTSEILAGSSVFTDSAQPITEDQLKPQHIYLHSAVDLSLLSKLQEIAKLPPANAQKVCSEVAQLLCDHSLISDVDRISQSMRPLQFKRLLFSFWTLVGQSLQMPNSCLADEVSWNRIASSMINLAGPVGSTAVLNWVSCLLDPQRAASLMLAGLACEKSSAAFINHLRDHPSDVFNVPTSPVFATLTEDQQKTVAQSLKALDQQHVLNLSKALQADDSKGVLGCVEAMLLIGLPPIGVAGIYKKSCGYVWWLMCMDMRAERPCSVGDEPESFKALLVCAHVSELVGGRNDGTCG
ncbi:unnamed protein product [Dibothriocephalus latus]|uniref:Uncharacterized protein n=1 Tax=Dibothriocephalus latus TaxID=60516 RepID=A0A3P7Q6B4_DIBLA|nr:unnamed protein product [Dibothriocephalus latus]